MKNYFGNVTKELAGKFIENMISGNVVKVVEESDSALGKLFKVYYTCPSDKSDYEFYMEPEKDVVDSCLIGTFGLVLTDCAEKSYSASITPFDYEWVKLVCGTIESKEDRNSFKCEFAETKKALLKKEYMQQINRANEFLTSGNSRVDLFKEEILNIENANNSDEAEN